ncbi:MAG: hypothetical protein JSS42_01155 [Proteobacteria bacterium]|nr:hypothetical protein [Pseudomonadota bacterium]
MPPSRREAVEDGSEDVRARALAHARAREPRGPRAPRIVAISATILLHLLAALCLYLLMRPHPMLDEGRIEVRLLDAAPAEPALPEPPPPTRPPPLVPTAPAVQRAPVAAETPARPSVAPPVESMAQPHIFKADGSIDIPAEVADRSDAGQLPHFIPESTAPSPLMTLKRPVKIRPNHFASAWKAPENENLLGAVLRKTAEFVDKNLSAEKEFDTPLGKIKCKAAFMIVMAGGGCADVPPRPYEPPARKWKPATVLDEK